MKKSNFFNVLLIAIIVGFQMVSCQKISNKEPVATELRAPAYPLVTIDPYTSAWSKTDTLYNDEVKHWTGKPNTLIGAIRVDDEVYRFLGKVKIALEPIVPMAKTERWEAFYTEKKTNRKLGKYIIQ